MSDESKSNKISYDIEVEVGKSLENLEKVKTSLDSLNDLKFKELGDEYDNIEDFADEAICHEQV